jgi:hypothetical protein
MDGIKQKIIRLMNKSVMQIYGLDHNGNLQQGLLTVSWPDYITGTTDTRWGFFNRDI